MLHFKLFGHRVFGHLSASQFIASVCKVSQIACSFPIRLIWAPTGTSWSSLDDHHQSPLMSHLVSPGDMPSDDVIITSAPLSLCDVFCCRSLWTTVDVIQCDCRLLSLSFSLWMSSTVAVQCLSLSGDVSWVVTNGYLLSVYLPRIRKPLLWKWSEASRACRSPTWYRQWHTDCIMRRYHSVIPHWILHSLSLNF